MTMTYNSAEYRIKKAHAYLDLLWGEMYAMPNDAPVRELEKIAKRFAEMETFANRAVEHSRVCGGASEAA
jgi:hypothetical protein